MGRKRKCVEESEEEIEYETDIDKEAEVEVKRRRVAKDGYIQYRCSIVGFVKFMVENKKIITDERMELLESTPFSKLIAAFRNGRIMEKHVKKSDVALTMLLQAYDVKTERFIFCGKSLRICPKDICQILGLPEKDGMPPRPGKGAYRSAFIDEYFGGVDRVKKTSIEQALAIAAVKKCKGKKAVDKNNKDMVRLILLMLFVTFLFPNAGMTISWDLVKNCEDLDKIGEYGWGKAIESFLTKSIKAMKGKKKEHGYHSMGGCAVLILFWFCEKIKLISPISGRENEDIGLSKWCLQAMNQKLAEYKNLEKMKKLFKNVQDDKDDDSESEEEKEENSGEDSDSSTSSKIDDNMEDETVDIWLSQVSTQSDNTAADNKEEESKKNMKKVVAKLDKVIKEEIKERPNLAAAGELIEKVCKYKRLCEKKNRKYWKLILTARRQFEAIKERENELPDMMKQCNTELEIELKEKEEKNKVLREEKKAWEEEKEVLRAENASLYERVQTLENMIAALSQDTNGQGMTEKEEELQKRKLQDENALLMEENASLSKKFKKLQRFIVGNKDEDSEDPISYSQDRDEAEQSQCRTEVIGDYEMMYTAPEDQQMPSQTVEVSELNKADFETVECAVDYEKDWQIVEYVSAQSQAQEDHQMASQGVDKAAMKTPHPEMVELARKITAKTEMASQKHKKASMTPPPRDWPTFDLSLGLSPTVGPAKVQQYCTPTVQPVPQNWESPRVLSVEILSPTPEAPANKAPVSSADDIVLYSYVVRLKNRERVKKNDEIYWFEEPKKPKGGKKKKKDMGWFVCPSPITAIDTKKNLEIHYVNDSEDEDDNKLYTLDWNKEKVFKIMDKAAKNQLQDYWNNAEHSAFFWEGEILGTEITKLDIRELICNRAIANNVIDSYAQLLADDLLQEDSQQLGRSAFFSSESWIATKALHVTNIHVYLCEPLFAKLGKNNKLFFPIIHGDEFHYTLLVLDKDVPQWVHFNSKRGRRSAKGQCFNNAKVMVKMVEIWINAVKEQATDMLEQGCRMQVDRRKSSGTELKMKEVTLTEEEIETINWVKNLSLEEIPLQESLSCPQQHVTSLDCGPFVMYYMDLISKEKILPDTLEKKKVLQYRGHILQRFIEHRWSWNSKNCSR